MYRLNSHTTGVEQGSTILFSDFEDGGEMWTGSGPRELRKSLRFNDKYSSPPIVHVSLSMWDMDQKTNQRADISVEEITETGFTVVFKTWGDTRVARVRADWLAIGPVSNDDDWDVL